MTGGPALAGLFWCALAGAASAGATYLIKLSHQAGGAKLVWLLAACGVYGLGFLCYSQALRRLDITVAYPLMTAITIVAVTVVGTLFLAEALTPAKLAGLALLAVAVLLIAR